MVIGQTLARTRDFITEVGDAPVGRLILQSSVCRCIMFTNCDIYFVFSEIMFILVVSDLP